VAGYAASGIIETTALDRSMWCRIAIPRSAARPPGPSDDGAIRSPGGIEPAR